MRNDDDAEPRRILATRRQHRRSQRIALPSRNVRKAASLAVHGLQAMSRPIALGRSGRLDWTAFSRRGENNFSTVWLIRRDSCTASPFRLDTEPGLTSARRKHTAFRSSCDPESRRRACKPI